MTQTIKSEMSFTNMASLSMFLMEFYGQISDGMWENSRPHDHWLWINRTKYVIGDTPGYKGYWHSKKYGIKRWWNLWKKDGYDWAIRILTYAKFGMIINPSKAEEFVKVSDSLRTILDYLPEKKTTLQELLDFVKGKWFERYFTEDTLKFITDENLEKFYNSSYSMKDLKRDIYSVYDSVNTCLSYSL